MGNGDIIFTHKPSALDIGLLNDRDGYHENDLYYLEVCALNELCGNDEEICRAEVGGDVPVQSGRGEVGSRRGARRT